jgi:hypothetical protein
MKVSYRNWISPIAIPALFIAGLIAFLYFDHQSFIKTHKSDPHNDRLSELKKSQSTFRRTPAKN